MSWMCGVIFQRFILNTRRLVTALILALINNTPMFADDVTQFQVTEDGGIYHIKASVVLHAPADYVRNVLTDYVHIYRLNPSIVESEVLATPDRNTTRVRTKVLGCVAAYCEEIERVEEVLILPSGDIQAKVIPQSSQFKSGTTLWKIQSIGERSILTYEAKVEPGFFIPPVFGSYIVKGRLRDEITTSFTRLEKIASIQSERDWNPDHEFSDWRVADNTAPCAKNVKINQ